MKKFWNWTNQTQTERTLHLNGTIAEESWFDDEVTPQLFKEELMSGSGNAVTAGTVNPHGDVPGACQEFFLEQLGCDVIIKPTFLCDGAVEKQNPLRRSRLRLCLVLPLPELLHRFFPPFRYR